MMKMRWLSWRLGLMITSLVTLAGCGQTAQHQDQPRAIKGVLDLSAWEFAQDGPIKLSGQYEFYWQQHVMPDSLAGLHSPQSSGFINVPGTWNGYKVNGKTLGGEGYATYRLTVLLKKAEPLAFKFLDMATAYAVYVNGKPLFSAGVPGTTKATTVPRYFPQVVDFTPESKRFEIVFHVSNFHHRMGGAWEAIQMGLANEMYQAREKALLLAAFLFGSILLMGLYHLGFFMLRTKDRAYLFFGLFCLLIAFRLIAINERFLLYLFPRTGWELLAKLEYLSYYLSLPVFAIFLRSLYPEDFSATLLRTIQIISAVFCGVVLFTPGRVFSYTVPAHHIYTILACGYGVYLLVLSTVRRREGAKIILLGFSVLFVAILNDILKYFMIVHTPEILPFGLLAFIFFQAILLSFRFSRAFMTIAAQRSELEIANVKYEKEIAERQQAEESLRRAFTEIAQLKEQLQTENVYLKEEIKLHHNFEEINGQSEALKYVLYKVEQVAPTDTTVLLLGETGVGKELFARAIHNASPHRDRPLVKVDCAALPSHLIESELFGHEKGAFTSAVNKQIGRFEVADGTTIFLDEIGELPLELQSKLLRVLQDGEFERLGNPKTIKVKVRVIAATNRELEEEVCRGRFRQDLFYRLNVYPISVPSLRSRRQDIPLLVQTFVQNFSSKLGKPIHTISQKTMLTLQDYPWPGNIRELQNLIERAVITSPDGTLRVELPKISDSGTNGFMTLEEIEREHILKTLAKVNWKIEGADGAAAKLGLHPSTCRGRLRKLGIQRSN
jgi:DNA-binding NtrC family response regulator